MFKATLPTATPSCKSPRAMYLSPRQPRAPPQQNGRKRKLIVSNQTPQLPKQTTKNVSFNEPICPNSNNNDSNNNNNNNSVTTPLPKLAEEPLYDKLTHNQILLQNGLNRLFCESELGAIIDYALSASTEKDPRSVRKARLNFLERDTIPKQLKEKYTPLKNGFHTLLTAEHTLEVQNYLHFKSDSFHRDLSTVFGTPLTESHVTDPNPIFDSFLQQLQNESQTFLLPYKPYNKIPFPFIVGIGGPPGSGKTTICQFFQKAFDCFVIDVRRAFVDPNLKKSKSASGMESELRAASEQPPPPEYVITDSIPVRYHDEKTAATMIAEVMSSCLCSAEASNVKGFVIDGFPNNKNQQAALEKALSQFGVNVKTGNGSERCAQSVRSARPPTKSSGKSSARASAKSARSSAVALDGIIIAAFNDGEDNRQIDPITGNIYKSGFHTPGLADVIGICPLQFEEEVNDIQARLVDDFFDAQILPPKVAQQYKAFHSALEKTSTHTTYIGQCESSIQMLEILDLFILRLYSKNLNILPTDKPMYSLLRPASLIRPEQCFSAVTTWYRCLEEFGRPMADQSNLVSTFSNKVELLTKAAMDRFQLLISQKDERIELCQEFMKSRATMNLSAHFRTIWDLSIKIRNRNLGIIDQIVDRCGLIELLLELRKAPKIVFIALVHRLLNIMWFSEAFAKVSTADVNERTRCPFFTELVVPKADIPKYNFQCKVKPMPLKAFRSMYQIMKIIPDGVKKKDSALPNTIFGSPGNGTANNNNSSISNGNNNSNNNSGSSSKQGAQRFISDRQRPLTSRGTQDNQKEKENESQKKERKYLAGIRGYDYLLENLQSMKERPEDMIFFNSDGACNALGIIHLETKVSFEKQPVKYAEEFFAHVEKLLDSKMVAQEAKISLKLFRRFTTNCKRKEAAMVNNVFDLRDSLTTYAHNKCTREMELFARKFRYLKQGGDIEGPLFQYDMAKINEDVRHLADLAVLLEYPIYNQDLLSTKSMLEIAQMLVNGGQKFSSASELLKTANDSNMSCVEIFKLELALRVVECVECFDTQKFLLSFIRNKEDEYKLNEIYKRPPQITKTEEEKIFPRRPENGARSESQLSDFSYYSLEEEEEECHEE